MIKFWPHSSSHDTCEFWTMSLHGETESSLSYCYGEYRHDEVSVPSYANNVKLRLQARRMDELWKEPKSMLMCGMSHLGVYSSLSKCASLGQASPPQQRNCTWWSGSLIFRLSEYINICEKLLLIFKNNGRSIMMFFRVVDKLLQHSERH